MECGFQRSLVHIFLIFSVHLPYCPKHSDSTVEFIKGFHSLSKSRFISFYFFHYYGFIVTSLVIVRLNLSSFSTLLARAGSYLSIFSSTMALLWLAWWQYGWIYQAFSLFERSPFYLNIGRRPALSCRGVSGWMPINLVVLQIIC